MDQLATVVGVDQRRILGPALLGGVLAPRGEPAAGDGLGEVGRQAGDRRQTLVPALVQLGHRGQQGLGVGVADPVEQLTGLGLLGHLAGVHDDHPVGAPGDHAHVVGDEDHGHGQLLAEVVDEVEDLGLDGDVEGRGGLVGDEQLGLAGQRHGDHHPLAQASGELVRVLVQPFGGLGHLHQAQDLDGPLPGLPAAHVPVEPDPLGDLATDGQCRVQRGHGVLRDEGDLVAPDLTHGLLVQSGQVPPQQGDGPPGHMTVGRQQPHDRQPGGALAAPGLAHNPDALALGHLEGDAVHGHHGTCSHVEFGAEVLQLEDRTRHHRSVLGRPPGPRGAGSARGSGQGAPGRGDARHPRPPVRPPGSALRRSGRPASAPWPPRTPRPWRRPRPWPCGRPWPAR